MMTNFRHLIVSLLLTTGLASLSVGVHATEAPLGRLFFSQKERTRLDQIRSGKKVETEETAPSPDDALPPAPITTKEISVDGFVKRSSGKSTVWINQVPRHENENPPGVLVQAKGRVPASVRLQLSSGKEVSLKAGQSYDTESNTVNDVSNAPAPPANTPHDNP